MKTKFNIKKLYLVLLIFIVSQIILDFVLSFSKVNYFLLDNWNRFDSGHYIQISKTGYEYFPCAGKFGYPEDAKEWCGNTGWFPGYPLFIKLFSLIFRDSNLTAVLLTKVFYILNLYLVTLFLDLNKINLKSFLLVTIASISFGFIYLNAIFPMSGVLFWLLLSIYSYINNNYKLSFVSCILASFFYPTGFLVSIILAISHFIFTKNSFMNKIGIEISFIASGLIGIIMVFFYMHYYVSDWMAYFNVSAKYGNHLHNPLESIIPYLKKSFTEPYNIVNFKYYQTTIVIISYLIFILFFWIKKLYKNELQFIVYLFLSFYIFFPWSVAGDLSSYRSESLLLPFVFSLKNLNYKWLLMVILILLILGMPISHLFFRKIII